jgi:hypothetical protein
MVVFPPNTRLAGSGMNAIYAVRRDRDDLEYLQKYDLRGVAGAEEQ